MKKLYLSFILLVTISAFAQPSVKIYAYSQRTTPGMIPVDENGNPRRVGESLNYFIYAAFSPSFTIRFDGIWINGLGYSVQASKVGKTPVTIINNNIPTNPETTTLVPATKLSVISLQPIEPTGNVLKTAWFRDMIKRNELVISYYYKGKKYFQPVRKIKALPPVFGV